LLAEGFSKPNEAFSPSNPLRRTLRILTQTRNS